MGASEVEPLYVCVYVPEFPAQALLRLRPELAKSPVVVFAGEPPLEEVCSANAQAFRLGVAQGMTRAELDSFTGVVALRRSEMEEGNARRALLEAIGTFTPRVEVQDSQTFSVGALCVVLDMAGTERIFGPGVQALVKIERSLAELHFFVQIAASANFHTAVYMAPAARKALVVIARGQEGASLRNLPLAALRLSPRQAEVLALWGLHTLHELASLPEVELIVRLGQEGKRLRLLARGEHPHLLVPEEPVFVLEEFMALDAPLELMESLLFVLGPMLDQLLIRAQNRALALASVTVRLGLDGGGEHERTIKPALPVLQRELLLKLLHLDLQAHPPAAGILSIFLHAEPGDRSKVQMGLFAPQSPEPLRLDVTLARIAALVGEERVGRARLMDRHRPDSFVMERFTVPDSSGREVETPGRAVALRRYRPPLALTVQHEGKRLVTLSFHGKQYTVEEAYGPWRRSGEWWSAQVWSQEEWDVCATAPAETLLCLITHDLLQHSWQMEALYD